MANFVLNEKNDKIPLKEGITLDTEIGEFSSSQTSDTDSSTTLDKMLVSYGGYRINLSKGITTTGVNASGTLKEVLQQLASASHKHNFSGVCSCNSVCPCNCDDNDNGK